MKDLDSIYATARQLPPEERPAYLTKACGGDNGLRTRVEQMLAVADEAEAFITDLAEPELEERKPGHKTVTDLKLAFADFPDEVIGQKIGRYKLLEKVGEGGCGVVYVAEQTEPVRRRVALKVIKLGMDTKQVVARFEAERQALAMMDHPNIAKVLDAGATDNGRPYFIMELVRGIKITDYCDQANLPTKNRLDLFIQVCQAIQHAHQKGIIHRDIKPSNILVTLNDGVPVPKVIDFGIAKATEGRLTDMTVYTQLHQFIGTPAYMSPEQAEMSSLDIDTRSDIYSLGVLLYELLAGTTPFDAKELLSQGIDAMRKMIREKEPVRPSTRLATLQGDELTTTAKRRAVEAPKLIHLLKGDLDWIVMKCLEKDRTRRYETANGIAADLKRHLNNEAVLARPPSKLYEFQKTIRRHKLGFAAAGAVILALSAGVVVSAWQAVRATHAEKKTAETLKQVSAERDAKEQARKDAEAISTFLTEVFQSPDPARDGRTITVAETLDKAAKKLETDLATQPDRRANLQATLGRTYAALGIAGQAIPLQEKARDYYLATFGPEHSHTVYAMGELASSYDSAGRKDEALKIREEVLRLRRKALGPEHPDVLSAMTVLANSYDAAGRRDESLKMREEVLTLCRKVLGLEHRQTIWGMHNVTISYAAAGRRDEALKLQEEVLTLCRKVLGPEHPDTLLALQSLATSYAAAGRRDEALKLREEVLTLSRKVKGPEHPHTLKAMDDLAFSYTYAGRRDEALKLHEEVLMLRRKVLGPEHRETLGAMSNLAMSYADSGRLAEAVTLQEQALAAKRRVLPQSDPYLLAALHNLAIFYSRTNRQDEALKLDEEVLALSRKVNGPEHPQTRAAMNGLAWHLATSPEAAFRNPKRAVELATEAARLDPKNPDYVGTLGTAQYRAGDYPASVASLTQAIELRKHGDPIENGLFLAMARWQQGDKEQARADYARALASLEKDKSPSEARQRFKQEAAALLGEPGDAPNKP